jgi:hypothetical protein
MHVSEEELAEALQYSLHQFYLKNSRKYSAAISFLDTLYAFEVIDNDTRLAILGEVYEHLAPF